MPVGLRIAPKSTAPSCQVTCTSRLVTIISGCLVSCHAVTPYHVKSGHVLPRLAISSRVMSNQPYHVMPRHVMLGHVLSCLITFCPVISCLVISFPPTPRHVTASPVTPCLSGHFARLSRQPSAPDCYKYDRMTVAGCVSVRWVGE